MRKRHVLGPAAVLLALGTGVTTIALADDSGPVPAKTQAVPAAPPEAHPRALARPPAGPETTAKASGGDEERPHAAEKARAGEHAAEEAGTGAGEKSRTERPAAYRPISAGVSPSWFTPSFQRRLLASGTDGVRLPEGATLPGGVAAPQAVGLATTGIRPGQWLLTLLGSDGSGDTLGWCSANFVFKKDSAWGLGTAGHCGPEGKPVSAFVVPPPSSGKLPGLYVIGEIVVSHDNGVGDDFAMIRIKREFAGWMNGRMPVWGGPSGTFTGGSAGTPVKHFGHGAVIGTGGTPRAGAALRWDIRGGDGFSWVGVATPGDSGSGVLAGLGTRAAGDLTHIALDVEGNVIGIAGTRMPRMLEIASGWRLATGSLLPL